MPKSIGKTGNFTPCDRRESYTVHARTEDTCPSPLNALSSRHERRSLIIEKDILILFKGVKTAHFGFGDGEKRDQQAGRRRGSLKKVKPVCGCDARRL